MSIEPVFVPDDIADNDGIEKRLEMVEATLAELVDLLKVVRDSIEPALEGLSNGPIGKLLGMGK